MKLNENKVKELLEDVIDDLDFVYDDEDKYVISAKSKLKTLLGILEFENKDCNIKC